MPEPAPVFTVTFRALPGVDATLALRALLKRALRSHGLRCVAVEAADLVPMPRPPVGGGSGGRGLQFRVTPR